MHIRPLNHPLKEKEVGGKAASLSRLIAYGVVVPKGFVIAKNALIDFEKSNILPAEFERELLEAMSQLKSVRLIVRSSAIGEDSKSFSFAGQLDSFVVEKDLELVLQTIKKCWAGLQNNRVAAYQKVSGKVLTEMGVVIQEFVEADFAGVTFTKSPIAQDEIYTEYVTGAGEQLVSGKVTPKNFSVKIGKDFLTHSHIMVKKIFLQKYHEILEYNLKILNETTKINLIRL